MVLVSYFSDLKWISFDFIDLIRFIWIFLENTKPPSKPPKAQICPVLTVGWHMLSDFVVESWKSDFCDSSRVKIGLFQKKNNRLVGLRQVSQNPQI